MTSGLNTVGALYQAVDEAWPFELAEEWDRVGLVLGNANSQVRRVLLVVDVTEATVHQAVDGNYDAILAHHPLLFHGVTELSESSSKGSMIAQLIRADCALIAAHTNADSSQAGVAQVFAEKLALQNVVPLVPSARSATIGIGRAGMLAEPLSLRAFAEKIGNFLPQTVTGVRVAGDSARLVQSVAVCPGAGDSLLEHPLVLNADVYVTADLRHHPVSEFRELASRRAPDTALIDVSHWGSEWLWLDHAAQILRAALPNMQFDVSDVRTDQWSFAVAAHPTLNESERS